MIYDLASRVTPHSPVWLGEVTSQLTQCWVPGSACEERASYQSVPNTEKSVTLQDAGERGGHGKLRTHDWRDR